MIDRSEPSPPQPDPDAARVNGESSPCASLAAGDHIELAPTTCTCRVAPSEQSCAAIRCRWAAPGSENRLAVRRPPTAPLRAFRAGRSDPRRHHECSPMTGPAAVTPFKQTLGPGAAHNAPARALSKQAEKPHDQTTHRTRNGPVPTPTCHPDTRRDLPEPGSRIQPPQTPHRHRRHITHRTLTVHNLPGKNS